MKQAVRTISTEDGLYNQYLDGDKVRAQARRLLIRASSGAALQCRQILGVVLAASALSFPVVSAAGLFDDFKEAMKEAGRELRNVTTGSGTRKEPAIEQPAVKPSRQAGLSRDQVRQVQTQLNALGYNVGVADGIAGRKTLAGIARFRAERNLAGGGVLDLALLAQLGISSAVGDAPTPAQQALPPSARQQASGKQTGSPAPDQAEAVAQSDRPLRERLLVVDGSVVLPHYLGSRNLQLFSDSQRRAAREYGSLLAVRINPDQFKRIAVDPMQDSAGRAALCLAGSFLAPGDRHSLLSEMPGARNNRRFPVRWSWAGDNEFAIRRSGNLFLNEHLPKIIEASADLPMRVVFQSTFIMREYDFDAKGFRIGSPPAFSRTMRFDSNNMGLPDGCGSPGKLAPNTRFLKVGELLPMAPDAAEALLNSVPASERRNSNALKRLEQWTVAQLSIETDRQGRRQYRVEPVSAWLEYQGQRVAELSLSAEPRTGEALRMSGATTGSAAGAAVAVTTGKPAPRPGPVSMAAAPTPPCTTDCDKQQSTLFSPRRQDGRVVMPSINVLRALGFSQDDEAELSAYWDGLATSAWLAGGATMTSAQQDKVSDTVARCLATRALAPAERNRYLSAKHAGRSSSAGRWAGDNQFGQQRARDAFVKEQWPAIRAALPALPASFSLIGQVSLEKYDFDRQRFPIGKLSTNEFQADPGCAFETRVAGATDNLPRFLPMGPAAAEKLMQQVGDQVSEMNKKLLGERPKLIAQIIAKARPAPVSLGMRAAMRVQLVPEQFALFTDADMKNPVHQWKLTVPGPSTRQLAREQSRQPRADRADNTQSSTAQGGRITGQPVKQVNADHILDPRGLFDDLDLLAAIRRTGNRISLNAVKQMAFQQKKFDDAYYKLQSLRVGVYGGVKKIKLNDYEPSVATYFSKGERLNLSAQNDQTVQLLKDHLNWRLERLPEWPATIRVQSHLSRGSQREPRFRLKLNQWKQLRSSMSSLKYKSSAVEQALKDAGIDLARVYLPDLNVQKGEAIRAQLFKLNNMNYIPLFVLPWDPDAIRIPFEPGALGKAMGVTPGVSIRVEMDLELKSFDAIPVNDRFTLFIARTNPLELRVPTGDSAGVAETLDFRHGPAGDPDKIKYAFDQRTLALMGVTLGMTLKDADAVLRRESSELDRTQVALSELSVGEGMYPSRCQSKQNELKAAVNTRHRELTREAQQVCRQEAGDDLKKQQLCRSEDVTLSAASLDELDTLRQQMTTALPVECKPENQLFTPFVAYDINYGAGLKDRIVLFGTGTADADGKLVAMTRIFTDKKKSVDVMAKLDEKFGGHHVKTTRLPDSAAVWFENPALSDQFAASGKLKKRCQFGGGNIGVRSSGKIRTRFASPCGRYATYKYMQDSHYMLLIDTDQSGALADRVAKSKTMKAKSESKKAKAKIKF